MVGSRLAAEGIVTGLAALLERADRLGGRVLVLLVRGVGHGLGVLRELLGELLPFLHVALRRGILAELRAQIGHSLGLLLSVLPLLVLHGRLALGAGPLLAAHLLHD